MPQLKTSEFVNQKVEKGKVEKQKQPVKNHA
jgi:hypothetical protein